MTRADAHVITVGRDEAVCDVVVDAQGVSSQHCQIRYDVRAARYVVDDLRSTNGTFVAFGEHTTQVLPGGPARLDAGGFLLLGRAVAIPVDDALLVKLQDAGAARSPLRLAPNGTVSLGGASIPRYASGGAGARGGPRAGVGAGPAGAIVGGAAGGRRLTIGRSPDADHVIDAPMISLRHCEIELAPGGARAHVRDLGSTNGLFLNSPEARVAEATVGPDDVLYLGSYRLPVRLLLAQLSGAARRPGLTLPSAGTVVIGRAGRGADIELDAPQVSARHAEVRVEGGRVAIRDLGSLNGTWVNDQRIGGEVHVRAEDRVALGSFPIRLVPGEPIAAPSRAGNITLSCDGLTVAVADRNTGGDKVLVRDIGLTVYPSEFVGLMGPSGAGKTTLLQALNGYTPPTAGRVLLNGADLYDHYDHYRTDIGYVPQDDIVFPQLTVFESLRYTARLRLPPDTTDEEIAARIAMLLDRLEIGATRDVLIGDALDKGISGGQRKRVNLAQELLTEPSLLFLDEPTSGLASEDTLQVMRMLRELADAGKTIVLTIHQPSLEAYKQLDSVIYLLFGGLAYYGPAWPRSITYMNGGADVPLDDPGQAMRPLANEARAALSAPDPARAVEAAALRRAQLFAESPIHREFVAQRKAAPVSSTGSGGKTEVRPALLDQTGVLASRAALIRRRDRVNTSVLLAQAPVIALLIILVFQRSHGAESTYFERMNGVTGILFMMVASAVWFGCSNTARAIVGELAIYRRERMVNLRIDSYVLSKFLVLGTMCAAQCLVMLLIVRAGVDLQGQFGAYWMTLTLCSWAGLGMGLVLSAIVRSGEAAAALVPILLIPQIALGGVLMPHYAQPEFVRGVAGLTVSRWGMEALMHTERADETTRDVARACGLVGDGGDESAKPGGGVCLGPVPLSPSSEIAPVCQQFCTLLSAGEPITVMDAIYGPDASDPLRADVEIDEPKTNARSGPDPRSAILFIWGVLGAMTLSLLLAVGLVLHSKDPRPS